MPYTWLDIVGVVLKAGAMVLVVRLLVFLLAVILHLRWKVPVAKLERLIKACGLGPLKPIRRDGPDQE